MTAMVAKEVMDPNHPFDPAYGIMKQLQAELMDLRTKLESEQRQRAKEVKDLQSEVLSLKQALAMEQSERTTSFERVSSGLTSETALRGKAVEKCRAEIAETAQRLAEACNLQAVHDRQINKLSMGLETDLQERKRGQKNLDGRLAEEVKSRTQDVEELAKNLAEHKQTSEANTAYDRERIGNLTRSVQLAGQLLSIGSAGGPSKDLSDTLMSTMSTNVGSTLGERTPGQLTTPPTTAPHRFN